MTLHESAPPRSAYGLPAKIKAIRKLARWRQHVPYTVPLVILGALLAVQLNGAVIDWRLFPVLLANILAMSFAFMINDIQDAPDDALNPTRLNTNVINQGTITHFEGIILSVLIFVVAFLLFTIGGWRTLIVGSLTLVLSYMYSAQPFRLKARPIVDIVSHVLMLSGLLMLSGFYTYANDPGAAWLIFVAVVLGSAYGQFYNQLSDFDNDKHVGLKNTAILLGHRWTFIIMYTSIIVAVLLFCIAIVLNMFPIWLGYPALIIMFTLGLFRWDTDMRENVASTAGQVQKPILIAANIIVLLWLTNVLGLLNL
jgi:4-hydroxybenzoate polyprenyltransferase